MDFFQSRMELFQSDVGILFSDTVLLRFHVGLLPRNMKLVSSCMENISKRTGRVRGYTEKHQSGSGKIFFYKFLLHLKTR